MRDEFVDRIKTHEGLRLSSYQDKEGVWTIGYGRNLETLRISEETAEEWLTADLFKAWRQASTFDVWDGLCQARKEVLAEMVYNIGKTGTSGFKKMFEAIKRRDWERAAYEMLDSKWSRQVGLRARRLARIMATGSTT